jgi:hypothetical protein
VKARVFQLDSDPHRAAQTLLPWYGNSTLDAEERIWFEAHLGECPRCQADVEFQRHLQTLPAAVPAGAADRGWLALRARLDAKPAADIRPATKASGWAGRWLPLALGLQAVLVLVLATVWLAPQQSAEYRTLGSTASVTTANALVVFRPEATEAAIRQALRAADARIVGGPTVTDAWLLRLPDRGAGSLARLRAEPAVARIESLEGEPAR